MRKQTLRAVAMLSLLLSLAVSSTQAQSAKSVVVTIPFDFTVGGKTLPAGDYIVKRSTQYSEDGIQILRKDSGGGAFVLTIPIQSGAAKETSKLVFNRYDDQYFLSQVWASGSSYGRELLKTRQERTLGRELAKNGSEPQTVAVLARQR